MLRMSTISLRCAFKAISSNAFGGRRDQIIATLATWRQDDDVLIVPATGGTFYNWEDET